MSRGAHLGDAHNFGRRVSVTGARVQKPRTVLWEWLVLAGESPLRRLLQDAAERDGLGPDVFGFLPSLKFAHTRRRGGGEVQRVKLDPLPRPTPARRRALATIAGRSIALWSWLGVSDLHWENLVLGLDARGRVIFAPLDVEMILSDLSLPTETKLLPDADPEYAEICRHASGARRLLPYLGKPIDASDLVAMASAYLAMLAFLDRHARAVAGVLARLPGLRDTPIRVCLRSTDEYMRARSAPIWPPLLDAESEQLARGDIPYFFRLYGQPGIHYYGDRSLTVRRTLPRHGDVPQLDPELSIARGLRASSRTKLREEGLFVLLSAFDHPSLAGRRDAGDLSVTFGARTLRIETSTGETLSTRRNLRELVSSVYSACRCGEVRSAFVPPTTTCKRVAGSPF